MVNWKNDLYLSTCLLLFSGFVFIKAFEFPEEAAYFPKLFSSVLGILAILLLISSLYRKNSASTNEKTNYKNTIFIILGLIVYALVLRTIGYVISTGVLVLYVIYILGYRKIRNIILVSVISVIFAYVIFGMFLKVPLPHLFN